MTDTQAADPEQQLALYRLAVDALGGISAHAALLDFSTRHGARLYAGERQLHDGILRETATALTERAALCRDLERRISPAFVGNLTERQQQHYGRGSGPRFDKREA